VRVFQEKSTLRFRFPVLILFAAAKLSAAQAQISLDVPNAPLPALFIHGHEPAMPVLEITQNPTPDAPPGSAKQDAPGPGPQDEAEPRRTMFPHSETARYWISGQSNTIFQGKPGFHSLYQGANSLDSAAEYKTSQVETLYLGFQPHRNLRYNTDLLLDLESAGGRGIGQALGLAGFTNLDVVRNPSLGTAPYLARGEIHQIIGLTSQMVESDRNPFSPATRIPERRFEIRVGKMGANDFLDVNDVASDSHLQFMNWTVDDNGAWDYAADTRGYTVGGLLEYDDRHWSARFGLFAMPTVANGLDLDWAFSRARGQNWEYELRHSFIPGRKGTTKMLAFANTAHMGNYRLAVQHYLAGRTPAPDIVSVERFGTMKYGFSWNDEQDVTDHLRLATRFGWNDDHEESWAYTEVAQTVVIAADYTAVRWHRPLDLVGAAFVSNAIKKDHQNYLKYGGTGFLLGDGGLNYGRETIGESYYTAHAWKGLFFALDFEHIANPGYNRDRGPVWVGAVRGHIDF
jgi:high affinity Mn2+ porin